MDNASSDGSVTVFQVEYMYPGSWTTTRPMCHMVMHKDYQILLEKYNLLEKELRESK